MLIDRENGWIVGYLLADHTPARTPEERPGGKRRQLPYLPADANIRAGRDLIVASEDAVSYDWTEDEVLDREPGRAVGRWADPLPASDRLNTWVQTTGPDSHLHPMAQPTEVDPDGRETNPHVR